MSANSDWTVLDVPGILDIAGKAARKVSQQYEHTLEFEDAQQEAYIVLASNGDVVREYLAAEQFGLLHNWLYQRLVDNVKTEAGHRATQVSYERAREGQE